MPKTAKVAKMLVDAGVKSGHEFTLPHLLEMVEDIRPGELTSALSELEKEGRVRQVFRVMSPTEGGGIEDYDSIMDIPESIHDWHAGRDIEVTPDNIEVVYIINTL